MGAVEVKVFRLILGNRDKTIITNSYISNGDKLNYYINILIASFSPLKANEKPLKLLQRVLY
jgi:hypothetical protein